MARFPRARCAPVGAASARGNARLPLRGAFGGMPFEGTANEAATAIPALLAVLPLLLLGFRVPRPGVVWLGCALVSLIAQHLRVTASLFALHVGEPLYRRLRGPVRVVSVVGTLAFVAVAASMVTDHGGLRGVAVKGFRRIGQVVGQAQQQFTRQFAPLG
mgnify:CR=1 FL=1